MTTTDRMKRLYRRLSLVGLSPAFVRGKVLPQSWRDDMGVDEARYQRLLEFLSRHLAINLGSLQDISSPLVFDDTRSRFFKGPDVTEEADAGLKVAEGVARIALAGLSLTGSTDIPSAAAVRRKMLEAGQPWVSFRGLLAFCWQNGIPVIHVANLPPKARKLRGIAVEVDRRRAIVLCQQHRYSARHLTPLAHEIGHLASQHIDFIGLMASTEEELRFNDRTEAEAHRYATNLLTGGQEILPDLRPYRRPENLVEAVYQTAHASHIDPGYLIVIRASYTHDWREANVAFSIIEDQGSAIDIINNEASTRIDASRIPTSSREFFFNITGTRLTANALPLAPAQVAPTTAASTLTPGAATYSDDILARYKALMRQGYIGPLSAQQERELAQVKQEIQSSSRQDERSQSAGHHMEEVNLSLEALETKVDVRIAQREAERRGETGQPA